MKKLCKSLNISKHLFYVVVLILINYFIINFCNLKTITNINNVYSYYETTRIKYAKVKENCFLFKTSDITDASYKNVEFIIPETYFVIILSDINTMITKVQYKNKIGYVAADSIKVVNFLPVNPTLEYITFDIQNTAGTQLRSSPNADDSSNISAVIPAGTENVTYVASTFGVIPTGGNSNIWYYAIYSPISDPTSVYEGYVYSGKTENLTNIELNTEDIYEITDNNKESKDDTFIINEGIKTILIVLICVPIFLVFILLVVGNKRKRKEDKIINEYNNESSGYINNTNLTQHTSKRYKKPSDFVDKKFEKKNKSFLSKYITEETYSSNKTNPKFPTYEIIDDDDLL